MGRARRSAICLEDPRLHGRSVAPASARARAGARLPQRFLLVGDAAPRGNGNAEPSSACRRANVPRVRSMRAQGDGTGATGEGSVLGGAAGGGEGSPGVGVGVVGGGGEALGLVEGATFGAADGGTSDGGTSDGGGASTPRTGASSSRVGDSTGGVSGTTSVSVCAVGSTWAGGCVCCSCWMARSASLFSACASR